MNTFSLEEKLTDFPLGVELRVEVSAVVKGMQYG